MANSEHLSVVKGGSAAIRAWQLEQEQPPRPLDLEEADLHGANVEGAVLREANLREANLGGANLGRASLEGASLDEANLEGANLRGANLERAVLLTANLDEANLRAADLRGVDLRGANLRGAKLDWALLSGATLDRADLNSADLQWATLRAVDLRGVDLRGADLSGAKSARTVYADVDLSEAQGLEEVNHTAPSSIGIDTLRKSRGEIPEVFLRGCGLSEWEIALAKLYTPDITAEQITMLLYRATELRAGAAIQISPLFISYSSGDADFVDALERRLTARGIRFWRDTHDLKSGRLEKQIGRGIALNPTFLLVLSKNSVQSDWVEWEAAEARKLEKELRRDVLCPIALDDTWKAGDWPGPLRRQIEDYHVLSFSDWKEDEFLDRQFAKLVEGLSLFYPGGGDGDKRP